MNVIVTVIILNPYNNLHAHWREKKIVSCYFYGRGIRKSGFNNLVRKYFEIPIEISGRIRKKGVWTIVLSGKGIPTWVVLPEPE